MLKRISNLILVGILLTLPLRGLAQETNNAPSPLPSEFRDFPVLTLQEAVKQGLIFSPQLQGGNERVEQVKTNITRAYALLLPFISAGAQYTLADKEIKLDIGSSFADLYKLAAMNCGAWDTATMGPLPSLCQIPVVPVDSTSQDSGSSATVIQKRNNWDANINVGISILNLRTWPQLFNVYTGVDLAKLQQEYSKELLTFTIIQTYFGIATAQEAVRLAKENLANTMHHMDLTEVRLKNGVALENERVRATISVIQARSNLDQALESLRLSRTALALLIGLEDREFRVEPNPQIAGEEPYSGQVNLNDLARRKDVLMLDKMEVMADREVTDVWMQWAPTISAVWNWSYTSNTGFAGQNTAWRAIVSLEWAIFNGGMRFAEMDEKRSKVREIRFNRQQALIQAQVEVESARSEISKAQTALSAGEEMVELALKNLSLVENQYKQGAAEQSVVLDAELAFNSARIQVLQGQLRLNLARISLIKALGKLDYRKFQ